MFGRIRIVALNFEAMSLSFIIVNVNIVILDIYSRSASKYVLTKSLESLKADSELSEKAVSFVLTICPDSFWLQTPQPIVHIIGLCQKRAQFHINDCSISVIHSAEYEYIIRLTIMPEYNTNRFGTALIIFLISNHPWF